MMQLVKDSPEGILSRLAKVGPVRAATAPAVLVVDDAPDTAAMLRAVEVELAARGVEVIMASEIETDTLPAAGTTATPEVPRPGQPDPAATLTGAAIDSQLVDDGQAILTASTGQRRAKPGGEYGANGEWYEGGEWIANTEEPKKHKEHRKATGRQEMEPYKWEVAPEGAISIYRQLAGVERYDRATNTFQFNPDLRGQYAEPEAIENRKRKIELYNAGERWVKPTVPGEPVTPVRASMVQAAAPLDPDSFDFAEQARDVAEGIYQRAVERFTAAAEAEALRKKKRKKAEDELLTLWLLTMADAGEQAYSATSASLTLPGQPVTPAASHAQAFAQSRQQYLHNYPGTALERLRTAADTARQNGADDQEVGKAVRQAGAELEAGHGRFIAETEAQATYGSAELRLLKDAGFATVIWRTMEDPKVRPSHERQNGQEVKLGDPFLNGLRFPGDPNGGIEETANCRCWLIGGKRKQAEPEV